jgi:hypothetical protein
MSRDSRSRSWPGNGRSTMIPDPNAWARSMAGNLNRVIFALDGIVRMSKVDT